MPQNLRNHIFAYLLLMALGGCASSGLNDWPDTVPHHQIFLDYWQDDSVNQQVQSRDEYLQWVRIFYTGNLLYPRGWLDLEIELLKELEPQQRRGLESDLRQLGITIGAEWAKLRDDRLVDSRLLALWASILQLAQVDQLELQAVDLIASDVELLFAGALARDEIVESRYAGSLGLATFGDF